MKPDAGIGMQVDDIMKTHVQKGSSTLSGGSRWSKPCDDRAARRALRKADLVKIMNLDLSLQHGVQSAHHRRCEDHIPHAGEPNDEDTCEGLPADIGGKGSP